MKPVYGFREFALVDGELRPIFKTSMPWDPGINTAQCYCLNKHFHSTVPSYMGSCGFWAFNDLDHALRRDPGMAHIVAAVVGSGRLALYTDGWRAQKARIVAIAHHRYRGMKDVAARYRVPYVGIDDLEVVAREHGQRAAEIPLGANCHELDERRDVLTSFSVRADGQWKPIFRPDQTAVIRYSYSHKFNDQLTYLTQGVNQ